MKCYICGETISPSEGVVAQPFEGSRHPSCDPQKLSVSHPGATTPGEIQAGGLSDEQVDESMAELRRNMMVRARSLAAASGDEKAEG